MAIQIVMDHTGDTRHYFRRDGRERGFEGRGTFQEIDRPGLYRRSAERVRRGSSYADV
jgi:hypothetical protein